MKRIGKYKIQSDLLHPDFIRVIRVCFSIPKNRAIP